MVGCSIKEIIGREKKPVKWLVSAELALVAYIAFTLVMALITSTNLHNGDALVWENVRMVLTTGALWLVYRIWPCRAFMFLRMCMLFWYLSELYPETYVLSSQFSNLDHHFAHLEQMIFGCQPALLFCKAYDSHVFSELMNFGYSMYFPMFVSFFWYIAFTQYKDMLRVCFIILTSFYIYYVIYDLLPVTGPQYYYLAAGVENIAAGTFPDVGMYFQSHTEMLPSPGYTDGFFYGLVETAHASGERPTAAFPSSHVGIATVTMCLAIMMRKWKFAIIWAIPYLLLCISTVYIQAHYAIDAIAGFITGVPLAIVLYKFAPHDDSAPKKARKNKNI